jgi:mitochondrial fission protein ELM1
MDVIVFILSYFGHRGKALPSEDDPHRDLGDSSHGLTSLNVGGRADPEIWVLLTHAVGDNDQCLAVAEALGRPFRCINLDWHAADGTLARMNVKELLRDGEHGDVIRHSIGLHAAWPRLIICSGRRGDDVAFWIKQQSGGRSKIVTIGRAHVALASYDLVIASPQYLLPERENVIRPPIPISRVRAEINLWAVPEQKLGAKPWFTILLGGPVDEFVACETALRDAAFRAQMAAERTGGTVIVSTSRRTPAWFLEVVESQLENPYVYRGARSEVGNPYATLLQRSDAIIVTGDSASMLLDACLSGSPTYLIELPQRMGLCRLFRRGFYSFMRNAANFLRKTDLEDMAKAIDLIQEWLHAKGVLRYPRDLRRLHAIAFDLGLIRSATEFDPSQMPARRDAVHPAVASGVLMVKQKCRAWLTPDPDDAV